MSFLVRLTPLEMQMAQTIAETISLRAKDKGWVSKEGHGERDQPFKRHLRHRFVGACAEMATAKFYGVYFDGGWNDFGRKPEVAGFEIRGTRYSTDGRERFLAVYPRDPPERKCLCGIVNAWLAQVELVGWQLASFAQRPQYYIDKTRKDLGMRETTQPLYYVPLFDLLPLPTRAEWRASEANR